MRDIGWAAGAIGLQHIIFNPTDRTKIAKPTARVISINQANRPVSASAEPVGQEFAPA